MTDVDGMLDAMRAMPVDDRLTAMDDRVLAAVARRRDNSVIRRSLLLAGLLAVATGGAGGIAPAPPAAASPMPIGMSDYAPLRLLGQ